MNRKRGLVKQLQKQGHKVAMLGDGINDIEALKAADVSIAINKWTHASVSADISLNGKFSELVSLCEVAKKTNSNINQNLIWTFLYNSIAIVLSAGLLMPFFQILIPPVIASIGMAFSSLFVVLNASRLFYHLDKTKLIQSKKNKISKVNFLNLNISFGKKTLLTVTYLLSLSLLTFGFIECNAHMGLHRLYLMLTTPFTISHCLCCITFTAAAILLIAAVSFHIYLYRKGRKAQKNKSTILHAPTKISSDFSQTSFVKSSNSILLPNPDPKHHPHSHEQSDKHDTQHNKELTSSMAKRTHF